MSAHLPTIQLSRTLHLSPRDPCGPFQGPNLRASLSKPHKLSNGRASRPAEFRIKRGHFTTWTSGPSAEQTDLGEGWNHVVRGGCVVKATTPPPKPTPQPVMEVPRQPKVTTTRKTAGPKKPEPKSTAATKPAAGKSKKKAAASVKTAAAKPTTPDLVVPTLTPTSTLEDISDLVDRLPLQACVELPRRLLTSISSLPTGAARPRAVLKTVILFMAEYGSTP